VNFSKTKSTCVLKEPNSLIKYNVFSWFQFWVQISRRLVPQSSVQFICWFQQKDVSSSLGHKNPHTKPLILTLKTKYSDNTGRYPPDIIKQNKNKNGHFKNIYI